MRSLLLLLLLLSSSKLITQSSHANKTAYLNPTRLEILRTVEMGAYRRIMYAKQGSASPHADRAQS